MNAKTRNRSPSSSLSPAQMDSDSSPPFSLISQTQNVLPDSSSQETNPQVTSHADHFEIPYEMDTTSLSNKRRPRRSQDSQLVEQTLNSEFAVKSKNEYQASRKRKKLGDYDEVESDEDDLPETTRNPKSVSPIRDDDNRKANEGDESAAESENIDGIIF